MLRSGLNKAKKARNHVDEALDKVRAKPWAEPLGKALQASSKIVGAVDGFVPGANVIGGALSFGATLLNPEPSVEDLQKQLREIKQIIESSTHPTSILEKAMQELEDKIANPVGEIRKEFGGIREEMREILRREVEVHKGTSEEVSELKDLVGQTFHIVVDSRFKVGSKLLLPPNNVFSGRH